jgi:hypothetical protein
MIELKPRYFVLPAIAIAVLTMLHPASGGRASEGGCAVQSRDPGIARSFAAFSRGQSETAAKVCGLASNNH